jgi:maltose alpha-D-glucosyltransferase / alpha-amylase
VLDLVLLERASHEVVYEAAHRPDWIEVPLASLEALVERLLAPPVERRDG